MEPITLLLGAAVGWLLARAARAPNPYAPPAPPAAPPAPVAADAAAAEREPEPAPPPAPDPRGDAYKLAKALGDLCESADQGGDLERDPRFAELVAKLKDAPYTPRERLALVTSQTTALSCAALAAMTACGDGQRRDVARVAHRLGCLAVHFALAHFADNREPEALGALLLAAPRWWSEHPATRQRLEWLLARQNELKVGARVPDTASDSDVDARDLRECLGAIDHPIVADFIAEVEKIERARRGRNEVLKVGREIGAAEPDEPVAETPATAASIDAIVASLERAGRPSFVLVGPEGAGKTSLARAALRKLAQRGWRVVEASPAQMMADQKYIGEIEGRLENFVRGLGDRAVWFVPECHQLLEKGSFTGSPHGILDMLMPQLERGAVQILGESTAPAWARVIAQRPRVESLIQGLQVDPLPDADALALLKDWGVRWKNKLGRDVLDDATAAEAAALARAQFPAAAEPGRTLALAKESLAAARRADPPTLPLDRDQLLAALARRSGLPLELLDAKRALDVGAVRAQFARSVIGQDEAVDCLVDRIAMLKAGLTDPRRPIGVFLFAGPTGTGKTELAKTLAKYLFGSAERMLRFDMSEYQSDDSYWRLIDDGGVGQAGSLTARIRQTPFAVVLLDEFEKASPRIWDLFLQVFDDGRLTDRAGNTADFRHTIIVLTSNLGATIGRGGGPGFVAQQVAFSRVQVERAIDQTFRREFINRLDRVVVFNPLTRALMRGILEKELRAVLERRGFRTRDWAVEWEPSALEFLLDRGFTTDLGARPLKRAIDQHLLAPLARTIVEHRVPSGEQFLFIHADGDQLAVRFVDPDSAASAEAPAAPTGAPANLRAIALDPSADRATLATLAREIEARAQRIGGDDWLALKSAAAQAMQQPDFWQRPERTRVLDRIERADRIENGVRTARSLHGRLARGAGRGAVDLVRRLALRVALLDAAIGAVERDEPEDAVLELKPIDARGGAGLAWRDRLVAMYLAWADARGMRVKRVDRDDVVALHVAGFAAWQSLRAEAGLHVLEGEARQTVRVAVAAEGSEPAANETRVCRRYDDGPAPLVRDSVREWRTGRLDRVLAGDFDLIGETA